MGLLAVRFHPTTHERVPEEIISRREKGEGYKSPCNQYSHSQAIVLNVETHTIET